MRVNILSKIKLLKKDKVIIKTFTDKEVAMMIAAYDFRNYLNARNKVIIAMFVDTGIRMSELINIPSEWINETNIRVFGKGAKWRYVPVSLMLKKYKLDMRGLKKVILRIRTLKMVTISYQEVGDR